ncbi:MAG: Gfo/Idh/MocA family oxidoreductase [Deltaproteobacteria bacterium]|nr:Gfo/Idh/MocA family oxidoreductase [Deltaproteobacteria bacterium]
MPAEVVRAAVVGVGYLGAFHAEKYASLAGVELVGVVDADAARAAAIAAKVGAPVLPDVAALIGRVDCASIAVSTPAHHAVAAQLLANGVDVLVEKPITATLDEGRALVALAAQHGRILQVGHLERFNPAIRELAGVLTNPRFIECHRLAPFTERGTEVDVILDLMIHDLDVILSVVHAPLERVEAVGVPVLSERADIANARLRFAGGIIANVTASRVATKRERKIRFFQADTYVSVDYGDRSIRVLRRLPSQDGGLPSIDATERHFSDADPLFDEIEAFVASVRTRATPLVDGVTAVRAMEVAERIRAALETV